MTHATGSQLCGKATTCCKLLSAANVVADVRFVSGVGALVYLQDTGSQWKCCWQGGAKQHVRRHLKTSTLYLEMVGGGVKLPTALVFTAERLFAHI